jgi:hypothetical protein
MKPMCQLKLNLNFDKKLNIFSAFWGKKLYLSKKYYKTKIPLEKKSDGFQITADETAAFRPM